MSPKRECGSKRVLRSSEACFGRGAPANYFELECGSKRGKNVNLEIKNEIRKYVA